MDNKTIVFLISVFIVSVYGFVKEKVETKTVNIPPSCLHCLCMFSSDCKSDIGCNNATKVCGPFQITEPYWLDGGSPKSEGDTSEGTTAFENCANDLVCAKNAVSGYLSRYNRDCNDDGLINCYDYLFMQYFGAFSCKDRVIPDTNLFRFNKCFQEVQVFGDDKH